MTRPGIPAFHRWMAAAAVGVLTAAAVMPSRAVAQDLPDLIAPSPPPPLPPEITAFVKRLAGCNHWAGEEATDADRGAAIAQARFRLRCNTIEQDEARLRARFARSPGALEALDQAGSSEE